jgi:hypothetical protein
VLLHPCAAARAGLSGGTRRAPRAQTCAAVLDGVAKLLVNYQRNLRVARERALAAERGTEEGGELQEEGEPDDDELGAMNVEEWIGRQGHATVLLRVLQLMCSGEHSAAIQDLVAVQPQSAVSFDLVTRVLDLFSRAQPLLYDSAHLNSDATLLLFDLQLVETIMEMCHGPHERNQRLVFASTFLPSANRVFSTLTYVPEETRPGASVGFDLPRGEAQDLRLNDVICWFKQAVAACCLSFCDLATDAEVLPAVQIGRVSLSLSPFSSV